MSFYAVWLGNGVLVTRVGPNGSVASGWPETPLIVSPSGHYGLTPQVAPAPDGGLFVAYGSTDPNTWTPDSMDIAWRLERLTAEGATAEGWASSGLLLDEYRSGFWMFDVVYGPGSILGLSEDDRGGVFLLLSDVTSQDPPFGQVTVAPRIYRLRGDGSSAPDWPAVGKLLIYEQQIPMEHFRYRDGSFLVLPDGSDGLWVGTAAYYVHSQPELEFRRCTAQAQWAPGGVSTLNFVGHERSPRGDGGFFVADFKPDGSYHQYVPPAWIRVSQSLRPPEWADFGEWHQQWGATWFGDIGLASAEDGGAVFVWSQMQERIGLFARKFNQYGQVTGVTPNTPTANALRGLRYIRGTGIRASVSATADARLELFDLSGRRVSALALGPGSHDATLPGTDAIAAGIYFGRLIAGDERFSGKVVVAR